MKYEYNYCMYVSCGHVIHFCTLLTTSCEFCAIHQEEDKKARKDEYDAAEFKSRHRSLGNIRFIGELFKFKVCMCALSTSTCVDCWYMYLCTYGKWRENFRNIMYNCEARFVILL